jgi:hypothetical protein
MDDPKSASQSTLNEDDSLCLLVPEVVRKMQRLLAQKGLIAEDLLAGLAAEREKLFKEQYGDLGAV